MPPAQKYVFTIGLTSAASLDVFITMALCYYLRRGRSPFGRCVVSLAGDQCVC